MDVNDRNRLSDGYVSLEGGVDSSLPPQLIDLNQVAWAVNATFRDGWPHPRPGFRKCPLDFSNREYTRAGFQDGYFQGAGTYITDDGRSFLTCSVGGRIFTIEIKAKFKVTEIGITNDPNMANQPHTWFAQAERWLIVQNGLNPPLLYNGAGIRRAGEKEVPVGGPMAYGKGRLWVARDNLYFGGDLVWGDPTLGVDSVIKFTENDFLAEGGAFAVPDGPITGMTFAANLDTSLGDGDLVVATPSNIYAFQAPLDRTAWKNTDYPLQRYAARAFGALSQESMILLNGDVFYRSPDGIRSIKYARRDFEQWGNAPLSRQVQRAFRFDTSSRLSEASGANFDNRAMFTIQPQVDNQHGVWHRGLAILDFQRVAGMDKQLPPAWEGVWTGLRFLRILTIEVDRIPRCFAFVLSNQSQVQLYELTRSDAFDFDGADDVPIEWVLESRGMSFGKASNAKRLMSGVQWLDQILGEVSVTAKYRADNSECWRNWAAWSDCVKYRECEATDLCSEYPYSAVRPVDTFRSQTRPFVGLPQPPDLPEHQTGGLTRDGYEFQVRLENSGQFRLKRFTALAHEHEQDLYGHLENTTCTDETPEDCPDGTCRGVTCCDPDDFGYRINSEDPPGAVDPNDPNYPVVPGDPIYPGATSPPGYPGYPGEPPGDPGIIGPADNPTFDPTNEPPTAPPTEQAPPGVTPCDGTVVVIESDYVWGLAYGQDPNTYLTQEQIDCHQALFNLEVALWQEYYEAAGNTVTVVEGTKWYWNGANGLFYAMVRKSTCNPFDGIDDHVLPFNGYYTLTKALCIT